jgi:RimJ/RimL family protein N-acetyltransferase
LLEGKTANLRLEEREDLPLVAGWLNSLEFQGDYGPVMQLPKPELEKQYEGFSSEMRVFIIEKKDGTGVGVIGHYLVGLLFEIGFAIIPSERSKGYGSEAVQIIVDYLFLSKGLERVQAHVDVRNAVSQKVLEKAGFKKEGVIRKYAFLRGEWRDMFAYSILREEWKEPKILTKTSIS